MPQAPDFTYVLSTDVGKVRLLLADSDRDRAAFTDTELTHLVSTYGSVERAVGAAARILLMDRARRARIYSTADGESDDETAGIGTLQELVRQYGGTPAVLPRATTVALKQLPFDPCEVT